MVRGSVCYGSKSNTQKNLHVFMKIGVHAKFVITILDVIVNMIEGEGGGQRGTYVTIY